MTQLITFLILAAAGAALVIQNMLMVKITSTAPTILIALVLNSAVGLVLLVTLLMGKMGTAGISELFGAIRPWALLPGLLGAFFVFASISGYQNLGASRTIAILVASQLIVGLSVDIIRSGTEAMLKNLPAIGGAVLLVIGAFLVASRKF